MSTGANDAPASGPTPRGGRLTRLRNVHRAASTLTFNTLLLLVLLNICLWPIQALSDLLKTKRPPDQLFNADGSPTDNGRRTGYQLRWFDVHAYGLPEAHAGEVLDDFFALARQGFAYEPWIQFTEPVYAGRRVNVEPGASTPPLRRTVPSPGPDARNVLEIVVLGGSTTFGYFVADEDTWPSQLAAALNEQARAEGRSEQVRVLNHGHGFFNPSQELALLQTLLRRGQRPDLVIFMDGVNFGNGSDAPQFTRDLRDAMSSIQHPRIEHSFVDHFQSVPIVRLGRSVRYRLGRANPREAGERSEVTLEPPADVARRFEDCRRMSAATCERYGIPSLFCLQPNAVADYRIELYRRAVPDDFHERRAQVRAVYELLRATGAWADLSGLFETFGHDRKAIVDDCHYSPKFNELLARQVAKRVDLDALIRMRAARSTGPSSPR